MKKIAVIGNSIAGYQAALNLREHNAEYEIVIFSLDGTLSYNADLVASFLAGECSTNNLLFVSEKVLTEKNIQFIKDKKITRINLNRKKIFTEDKEQFSFDVIILSDTPEYKSQDRRGANKTGVCSFYRLSDLIKIQKSIGLVDCISIQTDFLSGLNIASAISQRCKETLLVINKNDFWAKHLPLNIKQHINCCLEVHKIQIVWDSEVQEFLGDEDLKAIRLISGKVFATDFCLLDTPAFDLRVFSESELSMDKRIFVDEFFQSNIPDVFVVDALAHRKELDEVAPCVLTVEELQQQGNIVSQKILGLDINMNENIIFSQSVKCGDISFDVCRKSKMTIPVEVRDSTFTDPFKFSKIFIGNNRLVGVLLVNNFSQLQRFQSFICDSSDLTAPLDSVFNDDYTLAGFAAESRNHFIGTIGDSQNNIQDAQASSSN